MTESTPTVVISQLDSPIVPHGLNALHRSDLSIVHVTARHADTSLAHASMTVLKALGKHNNVTGARGHISENVPFVPIWLRAHRTQTVIVSNAQAWKPRLTQEVIRLVMATGASLVLVADHDHLDTLTATTKGFTPTTVPVSEVIDTYTHVEPVPDPPHDWVEVPVPQSDWTMFRADCRDTLPPEVFAELDSHYVRAFQTTQSAITANPLRDDTNTLTLLHDLIDATDHAAHVTAVLRATQAAHFTCGYNLRVDVVQATAFITKARAVRFTDRDWQATLAYREPERAAISVLYGLEHSIEEAAAVTVAAVATALDTGTMNGHTLHPAASAALRAAHLERTLEGATPTDPFITTPHISRALTAAAKDLGILIANTTNRRSVHTRNLWRYRLGFVIESL